MGYQFWTKKGSQVFVLYLKIAQNIEINAFKIHFDAFIWECRLIWLEVYRLLAQVDSHPLQQLLLRLLLLLILLVFFVQGAILSCPSYVNRSRTQTCSLKTYLGTTSSYYVNISYGDGNSVGRYFKDGIRDLTYNRYGANGTYTMEAILPSISFTASSKFDVNTGNKWTRFEKIFSYIDIQF